MIIYSRASSALLFNFFFVTTVRPFPRSANIINRISFLSQAFASTCLALSGKTQAVMETPISLLDSVYGPVDGPNFPLPMPRFEAGLCLNGQRRYLWTDAFGVLAFSSIAEAYDRQGETMKAKKYRDATNTLVHVVHESLGKPRSNKSADMMRKDPASPSGYVGMRIGKLESRKVTDYGMDYDGQYWHYVDKWLLALVRSGHVLDGIRIAKSCFPFFFDKGDGTGHGGGIRWKLSVDATAPPPLQFTSANDDTLVALIVFSLLEEARTPDMPTLVEEIQMLKNSLHRYRPRVTDDPLGWGLEAMYDQFISGNPRKQALAALQSRALHPSHLSLPFRLYGAMIGARLGGESVAAPGIVDKLIEMSLKHEENAALEGSEEHSSINRVMLAMCLLCPGVLAKRPTDPVISLE